jgi:predicted hydrocarbon binding protein
MSDRDDDAGQIRVGAIRYLMMRPDVLMGVAKFLPSDGAAFQRALEESAFEHARASFRQYRAEGASDLAALIDRAVAAAASLGWGRWTVTELPEDGFEVRVAFSPFAEGAGASDRPVCAPIRGVLRAIVSVGAGASVTVTEDACAAQGALECRFRVRRVP